MSNVRLEQFLPLDSESEGEIEPGTDADENEIDVSSRREGEAMIVDGPSSISSLDQKEGENDKEEIRRIMEEMNQLKEKEKDLESENKQLREENEKLKKQIHSNNNNNNNNNDDPIPIYSEDDLGKLCRELMSKRGF